MDPDRTPTPEELEDCATFAVAVLEEAGRAALAYFRRAPAVDDKAGAGAPFDPVTEADREVERLVRARIAARFPGHAVLGEEEGVGAGSGRVGWTLDPIDGTRGFLAGFVQWGMLLALTVDGAPVLGVVHQPYTNETWWGTARGSRFRRGGEATPVRVRPCPEPGAAILASTDPHLFADAEADAFHALRRAVRLVRYGSDCYAYCLLASGQLDLVVESGLGPWDVQALIPLIEGAGGVVTDWRGDACAAGGRVLAAGDPTLHRWALERLAAVP
jgi:myo-inositol-1(or 4)-monophosphatase